MILNANTLESLYFEYNLRLKNFAAHYVPDSVSAEDIVEEAYIRLWEKYEGRESQFWHPVLYRIVRNSCIDLIKTRKAANGGFAEREFAGLCEEKLYNWDLGKSETDSPTIFKELESEVRSILQTLPEKCREVFTLSRFDELKNKEIAARLGISEKTVEKHITKALKRFASELDSDLDSELRTCVLIFLIG